MHEGIAQADKGEFIEEAEMDALQQRPTCATLAAISTQRRQRCIVKLRGDLEQRTHIIGAAQRRRAIEAAVRIERQSRKRKPAVCHARKIV
jgi:hypothetical protein